MKMMANETQTPTPGGAFSLAFAVQIIVPARLSFLRSPISAS
jgi:hypothetical protein